MRKFKARNRQQLNNQRKVTKRQAKRKRLMVAVYWNDEDGTWTATVDGGTTFTVPRDDLLNGKFFRNYDRPGTLVTKESMLLSVYNNDEDQQRLDAQSQQAGWEILVLSDEDATQAEYKASRNLWKNDLWKNDLLKNDNIYDNDEDLFFILEQALEYPNLDMMFVRVADSGRGLFFGHSDRRPTKKEICYITCATDEQLLMLQEKYQQFVLDRDVVGSRIISPN